MDEKKNVPASLSEYYYINSQQETAVRFNIPPNTL